MPHRALQLLGLGLKYCIQPLWPYNNLKKTLNQLNQDIYHISYFVHNPPEDNGKINYIPELYIKSQFAYDFVKLVNPKIETSLERFKADLIKLQSSYMRLQLSNIWPH